MHIRLATALLLLTNNSFAVDSCNINTIKEFYSRIRVSNPIIASVKNRQKQAISAIDTASQRPNPQLDFQYLKGDQFGIDINNYTLSAKHIIEFGDKRGSRIKKARNTSELTSKQLELELYRLNIDSTILFQKMGQLEISIHSVKEAIFTFEKVIKKLASRKGLNPEETVSLSTLRLASNDYKAQLNDLENEQGLIEGQISYLVGCERLKAKYSKINYAKLNYSRIDGEKGLLKLESLKIGVAESDLEIEKSLGYSNISIGPVVEYQNQGSDEFISAGIGVSFALPLFQTNNGGKLNAATNLAAQKIESKNTVSLLKIKRSRLVDKYNRSLRTLLKMPLLADLEKKHEKVEKLFARGIVSIPMTIESHRQLIDFLASRFETENDLLDTYAQISIIDGDLDSFESLF